MYTPAPFSTKLLQCDEKRPQCGNCLRYGFPCDFQGLGKTPLTISETRDEGQKSTSEPAYENDLDYQYDSFTAPRAPPTISSSTEHNPPTSCLSTEGPMLYTGINNHFQLPLPTIPGLSLHDLSIFHHYANCTSATLSDRDSVQLTWRVAVTKEALSHEFLMHALLSFASAQLVQLCPAQR